MTTADLPAFIRDNYEIHEWRHASAILKQDFSEEYGDICDVLSRFRLKKSHIVVGGGRKSKVSEWIDSELAEDQGRRRCGLPTLGHRNTEHALC